MKFKAIIVLALLFIMSTSHANEFVFSFFGNDTCSTTQHTDLFEKLESHTDEYCKAHCEIHCEYHSPFLLPQFNPISKVSTLNLPPMSKQYLYTFQTNLEFFKPPIV